MDQISKVLYINFALTRLKVFKVGYQREVNLCRDDIFDRYKIVCDVTLAHQSAGVDVKELEHHFELFAKFAIAQTTLASDQI